MLRVVAVGALPQASATMAASDGIEPATLEIFERCRIVGLGFRLISITGRRVLIPIPTLPQSADSQAWAGLCQVFNARPDRLFEAGGLPSQWCVMSPSGLRSHASLSLQADLPAKLATLASAWFLEFVPQASRITRHDRSGDGFWNISAGVLRTIDKEPTSRRLRDTILVTGAATEDPAAIALLASTPSALLRPVALARGHNSLGDEQIVQALYGRALGQHETQRSGYRTPLIGEIGDLWDKDRRVDPFRHILLTGDSGSGKSYALRAYLRSLPDGISVVVIDPTKDPSEYADLASSGFRAYEPTADGPINPLLGPNVVDAGYHEYLLSAIDQATSLSEMFPLGRSILNNALANLRNSDEPATAALLIREVLRDVSAAQGGSAIDAMISLRQRLMDVFDANGSGALCGSGDAGLPWGDIQSGRVVVTLARVQSAAQKRLIALCLLAGVVSQAKAAGPGSGTIIVLEEAHFFTQNAAGHDQPSTLVELLSDGLAELRSRQIGFVLAEQLPTLLPTAVVSNIGSYAAFANRDAIQADRIASALGSGSELAKVVARLPDHIAVSRFGEEELGRLGRAPSSSADVDGVGLPKLLDASSVSFSAPWCQGCPKPCSAPATPRQVAAVQQRIKAAGGEGRLLDALRAASTLLQDEAGMPAIDLSGWPKQMTLQRVAVYCLAARAMLDGVAGSYTELVRARRRLERWVNEGLMDA